MKPIWAFSWTFFEINILLTHKKIGISVVYNTERCEFIKWFRANLDISDKSFIKYFPPCEKAADNTVKSPKNIKGHWV